MQEITYYPEPIKDDTLMTRELLNGSFFTTFYDVRQGGYARFKKDKFTEYEYEIQTPYKIASLRTNLDNIIKESLFLPMYKDIEQTRMKKLTFTPPIKKLSKPTTYDFYYGDIFGAKPIRGLPFGFIRATTNLTISYYRKGKKEYIALLGNGLKEMLKQEVGKNIYTSALYKSSEDDSFNILLIDPATMSYVRTMSFKKLELMSVKASFIHQSLYLINYDYDANVKFYKLLGGLSSISKKFNLGSGILRFIRTYKLDLVYSRSQFLIFNKLSQTFLQVDFKDRIEHISFNPVIKSVCITSGGKFYIYRFNAKEIKLTLKTDNLKLASPFILQWAGNYDYDYLLSNTTRSSQLTSYLKLMEYRGHYMKMQGEFASDKLIGKFYKHINVGLGTNDDFHINNTDDADVGIDELLSMRKKKTTLKKIVLNNPSYLRLYLSQRSIVYYTLSHHNDFGKLIKLNY